MKTSVPRFSRFCFVNISCTVFAGFLFVHVHIRHHFNFAQSESSVNAVRQWHGPPLQAQFVVIDMLCTFWKSNGSKKKHNLGIECFDSHSIDDLLYEVCV